MKFLFKHKIPVLCVSILVIVLVSVFGRAKVQGFTDLSGCSLDCSDKGVMLSMKNEFESNYLEGFQSKEGFQSMFSGVQGQLGPQLQAQLLTSLLSSSTGLPPSFLNSLTSSSGVPPSLLNSLTSSTGAPAAKKLNQYKLRTVSRALQISPVKCEYEITYDKTDVDLKGVITNVKDQFGYFQATFTKNSGAECRFTPTEVRLLIGPEISKIDTQGRKEEIPLLTYTF